MNKLGIFTVLLLAGAAAGCGKQVETDGAAGEAGQKAANSAPEQVSLIMSSHLPVNDEFNKLYVEPVRKKYPNISLEVVPGGQKDMEKYIAAGLIPDLYVTYNGGLPWFQQSGIIEDMSPLFKESKTDLGRFMDNYMDDIRFAVNEKGELYGLPLETTFHALYYNKNIFDKFGAAYPKDGMTWEDTIEIAKKLTRLEGGVQYRGLDITNIPRLAQPLGLHYVDPKTEKAIVATDEWRRVFDLGKQMYSIPGNAPSATAGQNGSNGFLKAQTVAMLSEINLFSRMEEAEKNGLNWDVVQHPSYKERPNTFGNASVYLVGASKTSKYKKQALQVMEVLTSGEAQMAASRAGRVSPLKNADVQKAFGQDNPLLKGKNTVGIVKSHPVKYPVYLYREIGEKYIKSKFDEFVADKVDANTALRQAEEEINKAVEAEKLSKK
jgi:ABC-type glycerol-3-phosphate transport system substrate-binding protein